MNRLLFVIPILILGSATSAQTHTPKIGSPERKAIMDSARVPIQRELHKPIIFEVKTLKVLNGWAFLYGDPLQKNGRKMDYHGTKYQKWVEDGVFGGGVGVLLRNRSGRWRVVTYVIGPTDVAWWDWDKRYGCPRSIIR